MAEISAKIVMELRGRTGAGMMDCKKALAAVEGDIEKAIELSTREGNRHRRQKARPHCRRGRCRRICKRQHGRPREINCESDFVAKTDKFQALVDSVAKQVAENLPADVDALLAAPWTAAPSKMSPPPDRRDRRKDFFRSFASYQTDGKIETYIHMGGKVGVLVQAEGEPNDEVIHDVALQIAAASPVAPEYVRREEVDPAHLEHEKEILVQARNEGKPEKIIEKMVQGRIVKFYKDVCLLEQAFVKDGDISVGKMIEQKAKGLNIVCFTRYKMGDGLEKKVNDLAAEVAEQIGSMKK